MYFVSTRICGTLVTPYRLPPLLVGITSLGVADRFQVIRIINVNHHTWHAGVTSILSAPRTRTTFLDAAPIVTNSETTSIFACRLI
jgi:hypothetical protein